MKKRGVSPVIATVLLVSMAVILAAIIYLWANYFVGEAITKEGQEISLYCDDVEFIAEIYGDQLHLENTGDVAIYAVELREKSFFGGDVSSVETFQGGSPGSGNSINPGDTIVPLDIDPELGLVKDDEILIVPLLLGEGEETGIKPFICDEAYGEEVRVG